ncbi:hypothetical protein B566_EDAN016163 [Ephemera danica]|nr:hypothetical protein B566_EDAN016163 [Ephemera danica]
MDGGVLATRGDLSISGLFGSGVIDFNLGVIGLFGSGDLDSNLGVSGLFGSGDLDSFIDAELKLKMFSPHL